MKFMRGNKLLFTLTKDGILYLDRRLCVPNDEEINKQILSEAHNTPYSAHSRASKIYQGLKEHFLWNGMKKNMAKYVSKCLTYQKVTVEHRHPAGELQPIELSE